MDSPRIANVMAIVVMFNSSAEAITTVRSLLSQRGVHIRVVVVDNGSVDGSGEAVGAAFPGDQVQVLRLEPNRGYSGGANLGLAHGLSGDADYLWLVTDDLSPDPDAAANLAEAMNASPRAGVAGQLILDADDPTLIYYGGGEFGPAGATHDRRGERSEFPEPQTATTVTGFVTGASMFLRPEALRDSGLMDETFWLYWEDVDLSIRIRRAGWDAIVVPASRAWTATTAHRDSSMPLRMRYSHRNHLRFLSKHDLASPGELRRIAFRETLRPLMHGDVRAAVFHAAGYLDFFRGRSGPIRGRW